MVVLKSKQWFYTTGTVAISNVTNVKMFKLVDNCHVSSLLFTVTTALKAWESSVVAKDCMKLHKKFFNQVHVRQWMKLSARHRSSVRPQPDVNWNWMKFHKNFISSCYGNVLLRKSIYQMGSPPHRDYIFTCLLLRTGFPRRRKYIFVCLLIRTGFPRRREYIFTCLLFRTGFPRRRD